MSKITLQERINLFIKGEMKKAGVFVMDIIILVLAALFTISVIMFAVNMIEERDTGYSESTFYYRVNSGQYGEISTYADRNRYSGIGVGKTEMEEYYAVAAFYKAGFYRRLYEQAKDEERTEFWRERETDAEKRMGILAPEKDNIQDLLDKSLWNN